MLRVTSGFEGARSKQVSDRCAAGLAANVITTTFKLGGCLAVERFRAYACAESHAPNIGHPCSVGLCRPSLETGGQHWLHIRAVAPVAARS